MPERLPPCIEKSHCSVIKGGALRAGELLAMAASRLLADWSEATGSRRALQLVADIPAALLDAPFGEIGCDQALGRTLQRRLSDAHKEIKHGSVTMPSRPSQEWGA